MSKLYEELGLVNSKEMFKKAREGKYAAPAYNFNNMEQLQAIVGGCAESNSPVIIQVSSGARKYANQTLLRYMAQGAVEMVRKDLKSNIPICLHLDHGDTFELCKSCVDYGFSSVMIDGSHHPYEKNIEVTKQVVEYARAHDVTVEGELGVLAGIEDEVKAEKSNYTDPDEVIDFVKRTGVDSLAISIGTSHGAYKFKLKPGESVPPLRFDMLNKYGGKMDNAVGVPEEQLRRAAKSAVCKINIDSDGRLVVTAIIRKVFTETPSEFDPRKYLGPAREELKKLIINKNKNVLGSAGRY